LLGRALLPVFRGRDWIVQGWARHVSSSDPDLLSVDVTDAGAIARGVRTFRPDLLLNAAALTDLDRCEREPEAAFAVNREGAGHTAEAARAAGAAWIGISTDYVFDGRKGEPYREEDLPNPLSCYGRSKWEGEERGLAAHPKGLVVRVSALFGPGRPTFLSGAADRLRAGQPVPVAADQLNCPSYSLDLAENLAKLSRSVLERSGPVGFGGRLHLSNKGAARRPDLVRALARALSIPKERIRLQLTTWEALRRPARRPAATAWDLSRAEALVGPIRGWEAALEAYAREEKTRS